MFEHLKALLGLKGTSPEETFSPDDERVAVAALLVHLIGIDGVVTENEREVIGNCLSDHFDLTEHEREHLIVVAQQKDAEAVDLYGFTSILKAKLDDVSRVRVVEMLWKAVYADGIVNEFEDNFVWRVAELLGISTRERMILRKKVEAMGRDEA